IWKIGEKHRRYPGNLKALWKYEQCHRTLCVGTVYGKAYLTGRERAPPKFWARFFCPKGPFGVVKSPPTPDGGVRSYELRVLRDNPTGVGKTKVMSYKLGNQRPSTNDNQRTTALILGGSSGLGLATAKKLASVGFDIIIVHRDRRADIPGIELNFGEIKAQKIEFINFNMDATNPERRVEIIRGIQDFLRGGKIKVMVHSIAKGNLKPMVPVGRSSLANVDFHLTMDAMAISLYDWVKDLVKNSLFADDPRIISVTSEGNTKALRNYGAVSAAKAALEAITRNIASEFAPLGIKANCLQAGTTDTISLRMIPGSDEIKKAALNRNPNGRLTTPEDVANAAYLLTMEEAKWITGTVIKVDGGESLT